jgi:hypothetical protein
LLFPGTASGGVIFQYFESKYGTMEHRIPDVFMAATTVCGYRRPAKRKADNPLNTTSSTGSTSTISMEMRKALKASLKKPIRRVGSCVFAGVTSNMAALKHW